MIFSRRINIYIGSRVFLTRRRRETNIRARARVCIYIITLLSLLIRCADSDRKRAYYTYAYNARTVIIFITCFSVFQALTNIVGGKSPANYLYGLGRTPFYCSSCPSPRARAPLLRTERENERNEIPIKTGARVSRARPRRYTVHGVQACTIRRPGVCFERLHYAG